MYLSPESLEVEIVSAKSSEMNVMVPKPNGDYVSSNFIHICGHCSNGFFAISNLKCFFQSEYPVPEQFKTTLSPKGLLTVAVENKG